MTMLGEDWKPVDSVKLCYNGQIYSKKNSKRIITNRRTGKPQIISNQNAKSQEEDMAWELGCQARYHGWRPSPDSIFTIKINIVEKDRRRRDLDNQATAILDALVAGGVIPDDDSQHVRHLNVTYQGVNKEDPHATIEITEVRA